MEISKEVLDIIVNRAELKTRKELNKDFEDESDSDIYFARDLLDIMNIKYNIKEM